MNFKRIISYITAAALIVTALFSLTGCDASKDDKEEKKGKNYYFSSVISGNPLTLDPQTCADDSSSQIIGSCFQGLFAFSDGGEVVPAMAEKYTVSDDGLTWEFKLRENVFWYGKNNFSAECTADDYVFAFRRLMDPSLRSARAKEYYFIKNAEEINTGKLDDISQLGVEAPEKFRLRITLTKPRTDIQPLLAASPAMPCNEEFYLSTEGQYGLIGDCIGSNGDFYVSMWFYDKWMKDGNFIELKRNEHNSEGSPIAPRGVKFRINENGYECFLNEDTHVYRTADSDEIFRLSGKYEYANYSTAVWGFIFNNKGVFSNSDLRTALGGCVSGEFDGSIYTRADCIVPDGIKIGDSVYRSLAGKTELHRYSEDELLERGTRAMRKLDDGQLSGMKILIPEGTALKQSIGAVIQKWQQNYGIYARISELPYSDYISALTSGNYDAAVVRLSGGGRGAVDYLNAFSSGSSKNYANVESRKLENILDSARNAADVKTASMYCLEAEQLILDNAWFVPLCFEKEYVFFQSGVSGIGYDPFSGAYLFKNALKK